MRSERLLIGLGTGRCGTVSLAYLLNAQMNTRVMHEALGWPFKYKSKWWAYADGSKCQESGKERDTLRDYLLAFPPAHKFTGDVGYYYLPYVRAVAELWPNVRFICLQRDKTETIASLLWQADRNHRNPWQNHGGTQWGKYVTDACWPKFDTEPTREAACEAYYDFYYNKATRLAALLLERFRLFSLGDLNTEAGVRRILDFCGFQSPIVQVAIHKNRRHPCEPANTRTATPDTLPTSAAKLSR